MEAQKIPMGVKVQDIITGFTGLVTGVASYITGCNQYLIAPPVKKDGDFQNSCWFDETRLQVIDKNQVVLEKKKKPKGGPQSNTAPVK